MEQSNLQPQQTSGEKLDILLVEDDDVLAKGIMAFLEESGFNATQVSHGERANEKLQTEKYQAIILDLTLPGMDGSEVLRRLRKRGEETPVLVISARSTIQDRVFGLDLGADDYMTKPFDLLELEARLKALLRRAGSQVNPVTGSKNLVVSNSTRSASFNGREIEISVREAELLSLFVEKVGQVVTRDEILSRIQDDSSGISDSTVEVYVHRLRKKLSELGIQLRTIRGLGYLLNLEKSD